MIKQNTHRKFNITLLTAVFLASLFSVASAQEDIASIQTIAPEQEGLQASDGDDFGPEVTLGCPEIFSLGNLVTEVTSENIFGRSTARASMPFSVKLLNNNTYPILDGTLYVKVFRKQKSIEDSYSYGDYVVDEYVLRNNVSIPAGGTYEESGEWAIPAGVVPGEYSITAFVISSGRINLTNPFGANYAAAGEGYTFTVTNDEGGVFFDTGDVAVTNTLEEVRDGRYVVDGAEKASISIPVINQSIISGDLVVEWTQYKGDYLTEGNIITQTTDEFSLEAEGSQDVIFNTEESDFPTYGVTARLLLNGEVVSVFDVHFLRNDIDAPKIFYFGVEGYPLQAAELNTLFACVKNAGLEPLLEGSELVLTVMSKAGETIHQYAYSGDVLNDPMTIKSLFNVEKSFSDFTVRATLKHDGAVLEEATVMYSCKDINPEMCADATENQTAESAADKSDSMLPAVFAFVVTLLVFTLILLKLRRNKVSTTSLEENQDDVIEGHE